MATIKLNNYQIGFTDQFFFDTNIWLLLYGTVADFQKKDQNQYTSFFETLIQKESPIFLTSMVISEFSNVLLRRDFNQWVSTNKLVNQDFKKNFVGTKDYKDSVETISISIRKILKLPNIILVGDDFNAIDKEEVLNNFKLVDFNDAYYAQLAILKKYKIVTNDTDFQRLSSKIDIITTQA